MGEELFSRGELGEYVSKRFQRTRDEIAAFSDEKICNCDISEWIDYYESTSYVQPLELFMDNVEQILDETIIQQYNVWSRTDPYEPQYYNVDGYNISFKIPFDGDVNLWYYRPSTFIFSSFKPDRVIASEGENLGYFVLSLQFSKSELQTHKDDMQAFVQNRFTNEVDGYVKMAANVNAGVIQYNKSLRKSIEELLNKRKEKAKDFAFVSRQLQIPMKLKKEAPNITPIPLKRINRTVISKPADKPASDEHYISDDDYNNIMKIIHNVCASMEETSRTFSQHNEEELRDFILATLGTHYENSVSGETFRKNGKTDIRILFDNKAAFIGECKIWHGKKKFEDAIQQLFGYTTWKDGKLALIIFNKENKDFQQIRSIIEEWVRNNAKKHKQTNGNMWNCSIYRPDTNVDVKVAISIYDLTF